MNESNLLYELYEEYHSFSRNLIYFVVGLFAIIAAMIWIQDVDISGNLSTIAGAVFIIMAVFTYQIPNLTFRILRKKYRAHSTKTKLLGVDSKAFHESAMQHRYK